MPPDLLEEHMVKYNPTADFCKTILAAYPKIRVVRLGGTTTTKRLFLKGEYSRDIQPEAIVKGFFFSANINE
jgi:hypothetical protein